MVKGFGYGVLIDMSKRRRTDRNNERRRVMLRAALYITNRHFINLVESL